MSHHDYLDYPHAQLPVDTSDLEAEIAEYEAEQAVNRLVACSPQRGLTVFLKLGRKLQGETN
jgi:hypothetical protein